ncbi:unnamed protein product [Cochlearia groenlandica]
MQIDSSDSSDVEEAVNMENDDHLGSIVPSSAHTHHRKHGMWLVKLIDSHGNVTTEHVHYKYLFPLLRDKKIILEFGPNNQPEEESGALFAWWLGRLLLPINYEDWRKVPKQIKNDVWDLIQEYFHFDALNENYKKFAMKSLSRKWKVLKLRLWHDYGKNTFEESIKSRPYGIKEEEWESFVRVKFSKKAKRNKKSRSHYKTPHTLGSKSIARKSKEIFQDTGKRPSRAEIFVLSRKKADQSYVNEEARELSEKLIEKMKENTSTDINNNSTCSSKKDAFSQVFGDEPNGRVRCVGLGPTPSTFFQNHTASSTSGREAETEIKDLRNQVSDLENKLEKMNELEAKMEKMNELEAKLEKMNDFINSHFLSRVL